MSESARPSARDRFWMEQALALAALGEGATSPNPRVGCVLVRDGRVVGSGYHRSAGAPHAEAEALAEAGGDARGATAFVNLEPCAHHGRTPPCCERLIRAGVRRAVVALRDPDPRVDGRGLEALRGAGLEVEVGMAAGAARRLNAPFLHWHVHGRPLVTVKAGSSLDGRLSAAGGRSRWITGEPARRFAHRLRSRHDAVVVGAGTLRRDDPRLTVRLAGVRAAPRRVVLAGREPPDPARRVFASAGSGGPVRVYVPGEHVGRAGERLADRADVVPVTGSSERVDPAQVLHDLGRLGVRAVLLEGGGRTIGSFFEAGLVDRAALFVAPRLLGAHGATPVLDCGAVESPGAAWRFVEPRALSLGDDLLFLGAIRREEGERCSPA